MNSAVYGFSELNAFAMRDGLLLGAFGLVCFSAILLFLPMGISGFVGMVTVVGWILLLVFCSRKRADIILKSDSSWTFGKAYLHSLLTGLFASTWVAVATYVWFSYFDKGYFVDNMLALAERPEMRQAVAEMEGSGMLNDFYISTGTETFVDAMEVFRSISPATYSGMVVSWALIASPVAALVVALFCKKNR